MADPQGSRIWPSRLPGAAGCDHVRMDALLDQLRRRRDYECRLTPDRALGSLAEAAGFLHERGMLTRTPDSALPSLYGACHEGPFRPGVPGFGSWPATKWMWPGELAERGGVYALKIHNGKMILLTDEALALADPICRSELDRMAAAEGEGGRLLRHLAQAGPSMTDDVQAELGLEPSRLRSVRAPLERVGALVSRQVLVPVAGGGHLHRSVLARWDQAYPEPADAAGGMSELLAAAVRAAVLAPERELARWFSWRQLATSELIDSMAARGWLLRPAPGWVATPAP